MPSSSSQKILRVFCVEDNPAYHDLIRTIFRQKPVPSSLTFFTEGKEILAALDQIQAKEELPDLIVLDFNLPGMNGREILAELRKRKILNTIPIAFLTTSNDDSDIIANYPKDLHAYFVKPLEIKEFSDVVDKLITMACKSFDPDYVKK